MPKKTHEVGTGGGRIGATPVCSMLTMMSSEEETNWEHLYEFSMLDKFSKENRILDLYTQI